MGMVSIILGSAVIAAFVSGVFSLYINQRDSQLSYITKERIKKIKELKKIVLKLGYASYEETIALLPRLKMNISAYGNSKNNLRYSEDLHIWELMNKIEKDKNDPEKFRNEKQGLIDYISALVTYYDQSSLRDVKGNWYDKATVVLSAIDIIFGFIPFFIDNNKDKLLFGMAYNIIAIPMIIIIIILRYKEKDIILINSKKYRKKTRFHRYIVCIILMVITILSSVAIFAITIKGIVSTFNIENFETELILSVMIYIGIVCLQYFGQMDMLIEDIKYFDLIDDIREKYIEEKEISKNTNNVQEKFDIENAIKTFKNIAIENGTYTAWKESIQKELDGLEQHQLNDLKVILQFELETFNKPDKFDLKSIVCNVLLPVFLGVIIAIYTIFNNEQNYSLVFNISMDIFILVLILIMLAVIMEHFKNKKTKTKTFAVEKILEIIEDTEK